MPAEANAGIAIGSTIRKKIFRSDAPSTRAASSTSSGRAMKKFRMNRMIHGRPHAVWTRIKES